MDASAMICGLLNTSDVGSTCATRGYYFSFTEAGQLLESSAEFPIVNPFGLCIWQLHCAIYPLFEIIKPTKLFLDFVKTNDSTCTVRQMLVKQLLNTTGSTCS